MFHRKITYSLLASKTMLISFKAGYNTDSQEVSMGMPQYNITGLFTGADA